MFEDIISRIDLYQLGIASLIFFIFLLLRKVFTTYIYKIVLKLSKKAPSDVFRQVLVSFERPLRAFFIVIGIFAALNYLPLPEVVDAGMIKLLRTVVIILIGVGLYELSSSSSQLFVRVGERFNIEVDQILLPFLSKLVRFALIAFIISIIASEWGYDVSGFVAGLGLGGLAFALAAQDSISNFFGGVIIITEKPFTLGDWIEAPSVEGIVEDITFRSTKVRTFAEGLVTVPNSTLANESITNWTKMGKRNITFDLGVTYDTPKEKLEGCVEKIKELLKTHEAIDQELIIVRFNHFHESSLNIFLYFFTKTTAWEEHLQVREEINLKILKILEDEGVSVAFPSRSIYLNDSRQQETGISE
ncbi:mechanosensitive ion channel family protein [Texcoconibacillus texcoconensis]|uniref:MscS family membrane protein n=1 Tax=Texcoconibacillus texcoconensis TaxID=1095777 RepID=A0A840QLL6_9BACI|nr:mechanosensitive ion channel family protein [Texcoconibacillus texcoconensis]MBB5172258.1 MscS family membrane protein [Texcoconibacillus texcoconensis]